MQINSDNKIMITKILSCGAKACWLLIKGGSKETVKAQPLGLAKTSYDKLLYVLL